MSIAGAPYQHGHSNESPNYTQCCCTGTRSGVREHLPHLSYVYVGKNSIRDTNEHKKVRLNSRYSALVGEYQLSYRLKQNHITVGRKVICGRAHRKKMVLFEMSNMQTTSIRHRIHLQRRDSLSKAQSTPIFYHMFV
ncbi:hypothetical protein JHK87_008562 [Glycine soja]|nr:hypothetical protein JHK87_008562 [Glycine soja]